MSVTLALVAEAAMQTAARWESKRRGKQRGWRAGEKADAAGANKAAKRRRRTMRRRTTTA